MPLSAGDGAGGSLGALLPSDPLRQEPAIGKALAVVHLEARACERHEVGQDPKRFSRQRAGLLRAF